MNIVFTIQHPGHVHLFRNAIYELEENGRHRVTVLVRDKEMIVELLNDYGIQHTVLTTYAGSVSQLALTQLTYELMAWNEVRKTDPDVIVGVGGLTASHVATLTGARSIVFIDSENRHAFANKLVVPFADLICTPRNLGDDYGAKQDRYDGFHELAYLHPDRFTQDADALETYGVETDTPYFVLRFVSWAAHHDIGRRGLSRSAKRELVSLLSEHGTVYITSEDPLPAEFESYRLPVPPDRIHDLLSFADLYIGDSQTMATEAAVLGTPAVRSNTFAGSRDMSNFVELECEYGLLYSRSDPEETIELVRALLEEPNLQDRWAAKRDRLIDEKIDVTEYMLDRIHRVGGGR